MGISSVKPLSRRGYLSEDELEQFADITVTDASEGQDRISQAEEIIDSFVGYQSKFLQDDIVGKASATGANSITLETSQQNVYENDYFKLCEVEIIGGTGEGQRRKVDSSTKAGVLTVDEAWTTAPDTTSYYRIYQLGKFPRDVDVDIYTLSTPNVYLKKIPENVKRAVAAQIEFLIEMGDSFFAGDEADKTSESIGDYSYSKEGSGGVTKLIAPKAKLLLKGFINRTGRITI